MHHTHKVRFVEVYVCLYRIILLVGFGASPVGCLFACDSREAASGATAFFLVISAVRPQPSHITTMTFGTPVPPLRIPRSSRMVEAYSPRRGSVRRLFFSAK